MNETGGINLKKSDGFYEALGKCFSEVFKIKTNSNLRLGKKVSFIFDDVEIKELQTKADEIMEYMESQGLKNKNGWSIICIAGHIFLTDGEFFIRHSKKTHPEKETAVPDNFNKEEDWESFKESFKEELEL